jgi:hypothetical protein
MNFPVPPQSAERIIHETLAILTNISRTISNHPHTLRLDPYCAGVGRALAAFELIEPSQKKVELGASVYGQIKADAFLWSGMGGPHRRLAIVAAHQLFDQYRNLYPLAASIFREAGERILREGTITEIANFNMYTRKNRLFAPQLFGLMEEHKVFVLHGLHNMPVIHGGLNPVLAMCILFKGTGDQISVHSNYMPSGTPTPDKNGLESPVWSYIESIEQRAKKNEAEQGTAGWLYMALTIKEVCLYAQAGKIPGTPSFVTGLISHSNIIPRINRLLGQPR